MSKPRGCKFFTHVQCEYNRCRGRELSTGHVTDCPLQGVDDEGIVSDDEDDEDEDGWELVQGIQHKPTPTTAQIHHLSTAGHTTKPPTPQASTSHNPWVRESSSSGLRPLNSAGITCSPSASRKQFSSPTKLLGSRSGASDHPTICQAKSHADPQTGSRAQR